MGAAISPQQRILMPAGLHDGPVLSWAVLGDRGPLLIMHHCVQDTRCANPLMSQHFSDWPGWGQI